MSNEPKAVVVFSGKRKSGKDYISDLFCNRLGHDACSILRLSGPLKAQYAKEHNLDYERLLDASDYKEQFRADMIRWGEEKRNKDPGFFCRHATSGKGAEKDVWIISDARRPSDIQYFRENYGKILITVRVESDLNVREKRGYVFTAGVDDADSECGLDSEVDWTHVITNNGDEKELTSALDSLCGQISL